jgi:uncharacterized surface anchored protein
MQFRLRTVAVVSAAIFFSFVGAVQSARAQDITGRLSGTVTSKQGGVIVGASVTITNEATGFSHPPITTDSSGHWATEEIPVGSYTVTVTAEGFKTASVTGKFLTVGSHLNVDVAMEIWTPPKMEYTEPITNRVTEGRLSGTVKDMQDAIMMGASVVVTNEDTNVSLPAITTDFNGHWVADDLPVGTYTVMAAAIGYKPGVMSGISVEVGGRVTVDMILEIADPDHAGCFCMPTARCPCGRITGTVTDANRIPIAKAKVTITYMTTGIQRSTNTDKNGTYDFKDLEPGITYAATIKAKSFHTAKATANIAAAGGKTTVDVVLHR